MEARGAAPAPSLAALGTLKGAEGGDEQPVVARMISWERGRAGRVDRRGHKPLENIMNKSIASAVFDSHDEAQRAVSELRSAGVPDSSLSIIASHGGKTTTTSGDGEITDEHHRNVLRGILGGGALGAGLGVAALAIPGVGPRAAIGAVAAAATPEAMAIGAAAGAVGGTLNEVLGKHGVSDEDARYYSDRMKDGGVFVSVDSSAGNLDGQTAREILYRNGGHSASRAKTAATV